MMLIVYRDGRTFRCENISIEHTGPLLDAPALALLGLRPRLSSFSVKAFERVVDGNPEGEVRTILLEDVQEVVDIVPPERI